MKNQKGQILIVVFSLMLLVSILVAGVSLIWQSGANTASLERNSLRAFYIAQAGIERGRAEIAAAVNDTYHATFSGVSFGGGSYDLSIAAIDVNTKEIISTGSFSNSTREIKMRAGVAPGHPDGNAWGWHSKNDDTWQEQ